MEVKISTWKISTLSSKRDKINEQPEYQRGEVWNNRKKALLIDSIIRGIDIPKFYLREMTKGQFEYEVADGQQRLNAILKFRDNDLKLLSNEDKGVNLNMFDGKQIGGYKYHGLPSDLKKKFDDYPLTIAVIKNVSGAEVRTLFGRLQEGTSLTPAEKRNALLSNLHSPVDNFCLNHDYFLNSRIPSGRYKHQDYLAHAIALMKYRNARDLKADLLEEMYLDSRIKLSNTDEKDISDVLDIMAEIDSQSSNRIYKKYNFLDLFWALYKSRSKGNFNSKKIAEKYDDLEWKRLDNHWNPRKLIDKKKPTQFDRSLYSYCVAFRYEGATVNSIENRHKFYIENYNGLIS